MDKRFRLPALLIIVPPIVTAIWYYLNTDKIGSVLFGEPLDYCQVLGCAVTRERFYVVAFTMFLLFLFGLSLLVWRSVRGAKHA